MQPSQRTVIMWRCSNGSFAKISRRMQIHCWGFWKVTRRLAKIIKLLAQSSAVFATNLYCGSSSISKGYLARHFNVKNQSHFAAFSCKQTRWCPQILLDQRWGAQVMQRMACKGGQPMPMPCSQPIPTSGAAGSTMPWHWMALGSSTRLHYCTWQCGESVLNSRPVSC
jgi:hypothetical protein